MWRLLACTTLLFCQLSFACTTQLNTQQLNAIGQQIFLNECNGKYHCLVDWNEGEAFPSLGIGHFIWYPEGVNEKFIESFPLLIKYMQTKGTALPLWLQQRKPFTAPWPDRKTFLQQRNNEHTNSLRDLLQNTMPEQTAFMQQRMQTSLSAIIAATAVNQRKQVQQHIHNLCQTAEGNYALIDYVNFKGEGLSTKETYSGQGWGLLQVLKNMKTEKTPVEEFAIAAEKTLTQRARNATNPLEKEKWLPGWKKRLSTYTQFKLTP